MKIIFDRNSIHWESNKWYNYEFIKHVEHLLTGELLIRGYLYLNEIYQMLGIEWNPDNENLCLRRDNKYRSDLFDVFPINGGNDFLINIIE